MKFVEYTGLSYRAASIESQRLITSFSDVGGKKGDWCNDLPERLFALREVMGKRTNPNGKKNERI